jgi:hypothetical protein
LNVVIIVKMNLRTQARAHVVLFSSDLALAYASGGGRQKMDNVAGKK